MEQRARGTGTDRANSSRSAGSPAPHPGLAGPVLVPRRPRKRRGLTALGNSVARRQPVAAGQPTPEDIQELEPNVAWRRALRRVSLLALLLSIVAHLVGLFTSAVLTREPPESEPEPIPVTLVEPEPPAPEAQPQPVFQFRKSPRIRVRETVPVTWESPAVVPPPPDVVFDGGSAGGGFGVTTSVGSALGAFSLRGTGGGIAGFGYGRGNSLGGRGTFEEYIAGLREVGLEVVFVIDATGSMGWVLSEVKERLQDLSRTIRRLVPVTRFGIVAYRDFDDPEFVSRVEPLSLSVTRLRRFLARIEAAGGGDLPEAVDEGLRSAIEQAGWTADAKHVVILLGDAPPHPEHLETARALARRFQAQGGTVATVDVGFDANPAVAAAQLGKPISELRTLRPRGVLPEFQEIARAGGGDGTTLEGDSRVIRQVALLIFGKQWAAEVSPLLADL